MDNLAGDISLYIHIPFCAKRCSYCDFNTYAGKLNRMPAYVDALCLEIEKILVKSKYPLNVITIFFGGGTPSLLPGSAFARILHIISQYLPVDPLAEISMEANPGTLNADKLAHLQELGFNRISIGMQSAKNDELKMLGRIHSAQDVNEAVFLAKKSGFGNINLDLIYGLPGQCLSDWRYSLDQALALSPEHLSLYALTLEPGVRLQRQIHQGLVPVQDDDLMADMYAYAEKALERAGYLHYEISNWAKRGAGEAYICKHNLQVWRNQPYLGFGAGAHGFACNIRMENLLRIGAYIQASEQKKAGEFPVGPAVRFTTRINRRREMQETMMLGLRLQEGVSNDRFFSRFGQEIWDVFAYELDELMRTDLIEMDRSGIRLNERGRYLSNVVFRAFVD